MLIPVNKPYISGQELKYLNETLTNRQLCGDGPFTLRCQQWLENNLNCHKALLTHSCTAALEMAALLLNIQPGDEIIMPSFTFVSTANAFVLRGGVPVFVDIRSDTMNMDEKKIEQAITSKTKAIVPVHYAGVACEMNTIMALAQKYNLFVVEDAAQAILSTYHERKLGSIGHFATLSFHETKNIQCGEGGALLINDPRFIERAEILREKGTNRRQFLDGQIDKYTWVDIGSSYLPSELNAAFLLAQLEQASIIIEKRLNIWNAYKHELRSLIADELLTILSPPVHCRHNAHVFGILLPNKKQRDALIQHLNEENIKSSFHYIPLHNSPFGKNHGIVKSKLEYTEKLSGCLLRLPLWPGMEDQVEIITNIVKKILTTKISIVQSVT